MDEHDSKTIFSFFTEIGIINQLSRAIIEARLPGTLTVTHFGIVSHLSRRPNGETPLQLASAFQVPKTSMTHMIKVLETRGYVVQVSNAKDGRSKLIQITQQGHLFIQDSFAGFLPEFAKVLDELEIEAFSTLIPKLENIRTVMDKLRDPK
jgi:DNA-binding MarR family transcriptional regulator